MDNAAKLGTFVILAEQTRRQIDQRMAAIKLELGNRVDQRVVDMFDVLVVYVTQLMRVSMAMGDCLQETDSEIINSLGRLQDRLDSLERQIRLSGVGDVSGLQR